MKLKPKQMHLACNFACWHMGMQWRVANGLETANGIDWSMA